MGVLPKRVNLFFKKSFFILLSALCTSFFRKGLFSFSPTIFNPLFHLLPLRVKEI